MTRIPYNSDPDDTAADKLMRGIAALPYWAVALAVLVIGLPLGWAVGS